MSRHSLIFLITLFSSFISVLALNEWESLQRVKLFADHFLEADKVGSGSSLFTEDVKGTIDVSTNIDGRELATQYIFGPFASVKQHPDVPNFIGTPVGYNVTSLAVQHTTVAATIQFDYWYATLNQTFPLEISGWFLLNDDGLISQFDMTFKRWAWAMDTIVPLLVPQMAKALNMPDTNSTAVLQAYLAAMICKTSQAQCFHQEGDYNTLGECMAFMQTLPIGDFYRMGENNLVCRAMQVPLLMANPGSFCVNAGQSGGDACVNRDYISTVTKSHFPQTWLAPKYVTPENKDLVWHIEATNGTDLDPLIHLALSTQMEHSWSPTFYASFTFAYFIIIWASAKLCFFLMDKTSNIFRNIPYEHQRNVVMYILNIFYTTAALGLQLVAVPIFQNRYELFELQCMRMGAVVIGGLYIFELTFRFDMRLPLVAHHILTITAMSLNVTMVEYTQTPSYIGLGVIWLFQATTEQPTFLGLMGYRMKWKRKFCSDLLKFASIQTLLFKCASAIALLIYWGFNQRVHYRAIDWVWTIFVWVIASGLLCTQFWGSWVTWKIGVRIAPKPETDSNTSSTGKIHLRDEESDEKKYGGDTPIDTPYGGATSHYWPSPLSAHPHNVPFNHHDPMPTGPSPSSSLPSITIPMVAYSGLEDRRLVSAASSSYSVVTQVQNTLTPQSARGTGRSPQDGRNIV